MVVGETYWELLTDPNHILFELTLMLIVDGLLLGLAYPFFKKWLKNHDEKKHGHQHCEDVHQDKLF